LVDGILDFAGLVRQLPKDLSDVVKRLKAGELTLRLDDVNAKAVARIEARSRNRMVGSLLSVAGLAASFYMQAAPGVPAWVPWTSFSASFLISIWVILGIRRSGGM
jgi:hypothetical protein